MNSSVLAALPVNAGSAQSTAQSALAASAEGSDARRRTTKKTASSVAIAATAAASRGADTVSPRIANASA